MSPQMAAEERLRRLAPLVAAAAGAAMVVVPALPEGPGVEGGVVAAMVAVAAALVAHAIAAARGAAGVVSGAVAGVWMAAVATAAVPEVEGAIALACAAAAAAMLARAAMREGEGVPLVAAAPVAVALAVIEPRAWAVAGAIAALVALRDRGRRRLLAIPAALAAIGAGVVTMLGAMGRAPSWAPAEARVGVELWLEGAVDALGPLAIVLVAIGVIGAAGERRARWPAAAMVAGLAALLPLGGALPAAAMVGAALALGFTVAAAAARVGRTRHQLVAAGAIAALMIAPFAL